MKGVNNKSFINENGLKLNRDIFPVDLNARGGALTLNGSPENHSRLRSKSPLASTIES